MAKAVVTAKAASSKPVKFDPEDEGAVYIPHTRILGLTKTKFPSLVQRRMELTAAIKMQQAELEGLNIRLLGMLTQCGAERVECAGYRVWRKTGQFRKSLSREKLLEAGVKPAILEKATVSAPVADSITILPPKEEKE